ncbi:MAG: methionyl-tRNA formyltransferase [Pseudomonadota bacterium]
MTPGKRYRLAFMGTPDFAAAALAALLAAGHEVACVYTQPPRPAGRGKAVVKSPVHMLAEQKGLAVCTPSSLKDSQEQAAFAALDLDLAVVAAYGLILPPAILAAPRRGCLNIHASLLPRWRGAAPIQRAIEAGDSETGISIMAMEAGLDTGPVLLTRPMPILPDDDAGRLHDKLAALGAKAIVAALEGLDHLVATPQDATKATYARKIDKAEAKLDFTHPAVILERRIRALAPYPGAYAEMMGERVKILAAECVPGKGPPGAVLDTQLTIACGRDALRPTLLQRAGKAPLARAAFQRGFTVPRGSRLS